MQGPDTGRIVRNAELSFPRLPAREGQWRMQARMSGDDRRLGDQIVGTVIAGGIGPRERGDRSGVVAVSYTHLTLPTN